MYHIIIYYVDKRYSKHTIKSRSFSYYILNMKDDQMSTKVSMETNVNKILKSNINVDCINCIPTYISK